MHYGILEILDYLDTQAIEDGDDDYFDGGDEWKQLVGRDADLAMDQTSLFEAAGA